MDKHIHVIVSCMYYGLMIVFPADKKKKGPRPPSNCWELALRGPQECRPGRDYVFLKQGHLREPRKYVHICVLLCI